MKHYAPAKGKSHNRGFALLLVLMALVLASTIGVSYVAGNSVCLSGTSNLLDADRAKYLAESGIHHALYMIRKNPQTVPSDRSRALNDKYYPDSSDDGYIFWAQYIGTESDPGLYMLTAEGFCGDIKQYVSVTVSRAAAAEVDIGYGMVIAKSMAVLPWKLDMEGDFHINGSLLNFASINGNASAEAAIDDPVGRISGTKEEWAEHQQIPPIQWEQYENYSLYTESYQAVEVDGDGFDSGHALADGRAVTENNPGGVVLVKPDDGDDDDDDGDDDDDDDGDGNPSVEIKDGFHFTGTIVVDGDVVLVGKGIKLEAVDGFPSIVTSGKIYVKDDAHANIDGFVIAGEGIAPMGDTSGSRTDIEGGLLCETVGYNYYLDGDHSLQYDPNRSKLYDYTGSGNLPAAQIVTWHD